MADYFEYVYLPCDSFDIARVLYSPLFKYFNGDFHLCVNMNALLDFPECSPANSLLKFIVANLYLIDGGCKCSLGSRKLLVVS